MTLFLWYDMFLMMGVSFTLSGRNFSCGVHIKSCGQWDGTGRKPLTHGGVEQDGRYVLPTRSTGKYHGVKKWRNSMTPAEYKDWQRRVLGIYSMTRIRSSWMYQLLLQTHHSYHFHNEFNDVLINPLNSALLCRTLSFHGCTASARHIKANGSNEVDGGGGW